MPWGRVPYAFTGDDVFLVDSRGGPVWPLRSETELIALQALARIFGGELFETHGVAGPPAAGRETVAVYGEVDEYSARLYAHLTGRRFLRAEALRDISQAPGLSVLITDGGSLTGKTLQAINNNPVSRFQVPGVICGYHPDQFRLLAILKTASARFVTAGYGDVVEIAPELPFAGAETEGISRFGGKAKVGMLRNALGKGSDQVLIHSHSDGVDVSLGPGGVLCPVTAKMKPTGALTPDCMETKNCFRLETPIIRAQRNKVLIRPEEVRCRVLTLSACSALLPPDWHVDQRMGIAPRLHVSPFVGAMIITCGLSHTSLRFMEKLAGLIGQGVPVGKALAKFRKMDMMNGGGRNLYLMGDPRVAIPPAGRRAKTPVAKIPGGRRKRVLIGRAGAQGRLAFLRLTLMSVISGGKKSSIAGEAQEALNALLAMEYALSQNCPPKAVNFCALQSRVIRLLLQTLRFYDDWHKFSEPVGESLPHGVCPRCGGLAEMPRLKLRIEGAPSRRKTLCAYCGVLEDTSADSTFYLDATPEGRLKLMGEKPTAPCEGGALAHEVGTGGKLYFPWPKTGAGKLAAYMDTGKRFRPGRYCFHFMAMYGLDIHYSMLFYRPAASKR
ncbi:MAG: hypothetical protein HY751_14050 [Nitrospinae bacterium]|nr:hypothetical protein [Nitrospinota bacterium]